MTPSPSSPTSSKRIDSGTSTWVKPECTRFAYSVAPTPQARALLTPPMQVWLSVAWMKSPGSIICSRATSWQMPGEIRSLAEKSRTPVWRWNSRCRSRRVSILSRKARIFGTSSA